VNSRQDTEARIERFLRAHFKIGPDHRRFARDSDLFEGGYVDSVGVVELLEFVAAEFEVEVPEDRLLSDEFSTVEGIARIVEGLLGDRDGGEMTREHEAWRTVRVREAGDG
jgi:acyl carrier protein